MACGRRGFLFGSKWVNEAVYAPGERLRSRRMIQPLRILIGASLECQYRTTRPRPRRNEKLITTPFRSSPATAPNLLEVADLFDGVAQATLKMDGFLERIVYLSAAAEPPNSSISCLRPQTLGPVSELSTKGGNSTPRLTLAR